MQPEDPAHEIAVIVRTLAWTLRRFGEQQVGLTPLPQSEYEVIRIVCDRPGTAVTDVARQLSRQVSNVSTAVRHLIERGLVVRETDPEDRRSSRLYPTEQARTDRRAIDAAWDEAVGRVLATMTADEVRTFTEAVPLLGRLTELR